MAPESTASARTIPAPIHDEIAQVFKAESGQVLAGLIRILGNFEAAEEVVQEAFILALRDWPVTGMPLKPGAWLRTTAKNKAIDRLRRARTRREKADDLRYTGELKALDGFAAPDPDEIRDDQLRLIFTCCHPSLNLEAQVALTLKTLGGLSTPEIARSFLLPEATIAQRIVRAKKKIRKAGIPYAVPPLSQLAERLDGVLAVLYLIFNEGYNASSGEGLQRQGLVDDGIRLGETLVELLPGYPEALGLLALMLFHNARRDTRSDAQGGLVLLADQDRRLWDQGCIGRGQALLERCMAMSRPGPYQIQAAIAALHAGASSSEETDWPQIVALYGGLLAYIPSPVVALNRAVAVSMAQGPSAGLALIEPLGEDRRLQGYYLYHSALGDLLSQLGRLEEARRAFRRALDLAEQGPERAFLRGRLEELEGGGGMKGGGGRGEDRT